MFWPIGHGKEGNSTMSDGSPHANLEVRINSGMRPRRSRRIDVNHGHVLADMLNPYWGFLIKATPETMVNRLRSPHPILAIYGPHWENPSNIVPLVLLETILTRTGGDPSQVANHYNALTDNGKWPQAVPLAYDTVVLTDLSKADLKQVPSEYVSFAVSHAMHYFIKDKRIRNAFTYSPEIEGVLKMHEGNGAKRTGIIKKYARLPPQFVVENASGTGIAEEALSLYLKERRIAPGMLHVAVMDYTPEMQRLRESQTGYSGIWGPLKFFMARPAA